MRLLAEHERQLAGYVHTLVPLWQDAEDVLQNTKLRLWEQFDSFQLGTDFAAWAITIAGYMVRTHRKTLSAPASLLQRRVVGKNLTAYSRDFFFECRMIACWPWWNV